MVHGACLAIPKAYGRGDRKAWCSKWGTKNHRKGSPIVYPCCHKIVPRAAYRSGTPATSRAECEAAKALPKA
jgi:hypothetical protein